MAEIKTKFSVGDVVFCARATTVRKRHKCPDCLDSREWKAISPAGEEYKFSCPRCTESYRADEGLSLDYAEFGPSVNKMTIGSVRVNTHDDHPVTYMCRETGIGSGSVYYEEDMFPTHDEAMRAAEAKAAGQNVSVPWVAKRYDKSIRVSDYKLQNAIVKLGRDERIHYQVRIGMLFDDLRACESIEDLKKIIEEFSLRDEAA